MSWAEELLINRAAENALSNTMYINKKILLATFNDNPSMTVILITYPKKAQKMPLILNTTKICHIQATKSLKHNLLLVHVGKKRLNAY